MLPSSPNNSIREHGIAEAVERYADWRDACGKVTRAYEHWSSAPAREGVVAFAAYCAALDQEESAAALYGAVLNQTSAA
jgi:hypothetical protein